MNSLDPRERGLPNMRSFKPANQTHVAIGVAVCIAIASFPLMFKEVSGVMSVSKALCAQTTIINDCSLCGESLIGVAREGLPLVAFFSAPRCIRL